MRETYNVPKFMKRLFLNLFPVIFLIILQGELFSQEENKFRIAFWNFENFFDPFADSTRTYNEYTEDGSQHWTMSRFYKKRNNMYKTILAFSEGNSLALLGICEIENAFVAAMLFYETPLKKHNYRLIHYEGIDRRGIDVAMVYSVDKLQLIHSEAIKVRSPDNEIIRTRDILYAKFYDKCNDTLHCFVNHWPSRYGGEKETIPLRAMAAQTLRNKIDSLMNMAGEIPKIIIMGDFNDTPYDNSILNVLGAKPNDMLSDNDILVNLFADKRVLGFEGTLKHQYKWQIFDQIIISRSLLNDYDLLHYADKSARIFHNDNLLIEDDSFGGLKLNRTYIGPKYQGGYSDHLPVFIDIIRCHQVP